jgi:hypothetical protein
MRRPWPTGGCCAKKRKEEINAFILDGEILLLKEWKLYWNLLKQVQ